MPKHKIGDGDVELECTLCEKRPQFSDMSHLLTHMASKAHLSRQFNLELQSLTNEGAKTTLQEFKLWFDESGLKGKLATRLAAKDQKKPKKSKIADKDKKVKKEPGSQGVMRETASAELTAFRAPAARMHPLLNALESASAIDSEDELNLYDTPTAHRKVPNFSGRATPTGGQVDPMLMTPRLPAPSKEPEINDKKLIQDDDDAKHRKGIQWPGMHIFDAATPDGKRMRNQRKDARVLKEMLLDSLSVEPAEISYNRNGEFRASRDIYGPLSTESSPVQAKRASPRKRKSRAKTTAMDDISTNAPRQQQSRQNSEQVENAFGNHRMQPPMYQQRNHPLGGLGNNHNIGFMPTTEEDEDFRLTFGPDLGRRRPLTVFRDAPEVSPGRTESPLEEPRFELPNHGLQTFQGNSMNSNPSHASPTPVARLNSLQPNNGSGAFGNGRLGHADRFGQFHARRTLSASNVYPPQAFHYDPNPLFTHSYTRSFAYGGGHNYVYNNPGPASDAYLEANTIRPPSLGSSFSGNFRQLTPMTNISAELGESSRNDDGIQ